MNKWYMADGKDDDIVVSSRIRLARNLKNYPYSSRLNASQREEVNKAVWNAVSKGGFSGGSELRYIDMGALSQIEAFSMVERHIISPEFAKNRQGKAVILSKDESVSIMLGEEDHIRIQVLKPGFDLESAYGTAEKLDNLICESCEIAFSDTLGFLTECPTNLGTGLRASVMLHLPALDSGAAIGRLANSVAKIGLTVRGVYGEGSRSKASLFQLSNQVTLGISEQASISNLKSITGQLISQERAARAQASRVSVDDRVNRALGVLKCSRLMSGDEMFGLLSSVRLGVSMGFIENIKPSSLTTLMFECGAYTIQLKGEMESEERDILRSNILRERLS